MAKKTTARGLFRTCEKCYEDKRSTEFHSKNLCKGCRNADRQVKSMVKRGLMTQEEYEASKTGKHSFKNLRGGVK